MSKALILFLGLTLAVPGVVMAQAQPQVQFAVPLPDGSDPGAVARSSERQAVANWTGQAVIRAFTLDHAAALEQLSMASEAFTPEGWRGFFVALDGTGIITRVREARLYMGADLTSPPAVSAERQQGEIRIWQVDIPMTVTTRGPSMRPQALQYISNATVMRRTPGSTDYRILSVVTRQVGQ